MSTSNKGKSDMREWKPGDRAMVEISGSPDVYQWYPIKCSEGPQGPNEYFVPSSALHPLPPLLTPEAEAVLRAADAWEDDELDVNDASGRLSKAVRAYRAAHLQLAEVPQDSARRPEAFKVGDRVRVKDKHWHQCLVQEGNVHRVFDNGIIQFGMAPNTALFNCHADWLELLPSIPAPSDAIAAAKERVVEAVLSQVECYDSKPPASHDRRKTANEEVAKAGRALHDLLFPAPEPDPVKEAMQYLDAHLSPASPEVRAAFERLRAALDAKGTGNG